MPAGTTTSTVEGLPELNRAMRAIADDLSAEGEGLKEAHRKASGIALSAIQGATPRLSGRLASSLRVTATDRGGQVSTDLPYGGVINWGWPRHNIKPAYFMIEGARASEETWLDVYSDGVQDTIDRDIVRSGAASVF